MDAGLARVEVANLLFAKGAHFGTADGPGAATAPPCPCFAAVARVVVVLAGGPIRGALQAHGAVAPLAQQSPGADGRVAAAETNGRGVRGDRRRPRSQMTKRKRERPC